MILTIDRIKLLTDPQVALVCDISPFVTCGPVMSSRAGALFGFPNPLLGIAGFALAGTTGMVLLAGARLARWYLAASKSAACRGDLPHLAAGPDPVRHRRTVHLVHVRLGGDHPDLRGHHREHASAGVFGDRPPPDRPDVGSWKSPSWRSGTWLITAIALRF